MRKCQLMLASRENCVSDGRCGRRQSFGPFVSVHCPELPKGHVENTPWPQGTLKTKICDVHCNIATTGRAWPGTSRPAICIHAARGGRPRVCCLAHPDATVTTTVHHASWHGGFAWGAERFQLIFGHLQLRFALLQFPPQPPNFGETLLATCLCHSCRIVP